jgi:hypothetical protein
MFSLPESEDISKNLVERLILDQGSSLFGVVSKTCRKLIQEANCIDNSQVSV